MRVFVINLERAKERRLFMTRQLKRLDLDFEFIQGVDFKLLKDDDIVRAMGRPRASLKAHELGAFSVSLSHRIAYNRIIQQGLNQALVVEDDVVLPREIKNILQMIESASGECEVALLAYYAHNRLPLEVSSFAAIAKDGSKYLLRAPVTIDQIASAAAYVVSQAVAKNLLALTPVDFVPDHWSKFHREGVYSKLYLCHPLCVKDAPFPALVEYPSGRHWTSRIKLAARRNRLINLIAWNYGMIKQCLPRGSRLSRLSRDGQPFWAGANSKHKF